MVPALEEAGDPNLFQEQHIELKIPGIRLPSPDGPHGFRQSEAQEHAHLTAIEQTSVLRPRIECLSLGRSASTGAILWQEMICATFSAGSRERRTRRDPATPVLFDK